MYHLIKKSHESCKLNTKHIVYIYIYKFWLKKIKSLINAFLFRNEANGNEDEASNFVIEAHHASIENMSFYGQAARNYYISHRSASAEAFKDTTTQSITSTQELNDNDIKETAPISVSFLPVTCSLKIIELINLLN